eukprot:m.478978 g.478978  ORF g.478978 m.478978 type:complete len:195 (+) comp21290_c0_seq1:1405-1989(+)
MVVRVLVRVVEGRRLFLLTATLFNKYLRENVKSVLFVLGKKRPDQFVLRKRTRNKDKMAAFAGPDEVVVAQGHSIKVPLEAGKEYYYCMCGRSANQPFCDGSHRGTSFKPMKFVAEKTETKGLCACKFTKNPPYCDGSHKGPEALKAYNKQLLKANSALRDNLDAAATQAHTLRAVAVAAVVATIASLVYTAKK